jgi:peptide/nickel transport system ATP-binding protein
MHPYTVGLMRSKPVINREVDKLYTIPGNVPNPINMPNYCYFKDRCEKRMGVCDGAYPHEVYVTKTHMATCYQYIDTKAKAEV